MASVQELNMQKKSLAPSLKSIAHRACVRNIKKLDNVGECPVHLVKRIINKIDNPDQLRRLEVNCPQIVGSTKEAWINMLQRDVSRLEERMPSADWRDTLFTADIANRWWKIYQRLKREADQEMLEEREKLAAQLNGIKKQQEDSLSQVTERRAPVVSNRWRTNAYATAKSSGQDFFSKNKRDAVTKSYRTKMPTHKLQPLTGKVPAKAPIALVEDLRLEKERKARAQFALERDARLKKESRNSHSQPQDKESDRIKDREARLQRWKNGSADDQTKSAVVKLTTDFLEESDEDENMHQDDDELFGIVPQQSYPVKTETGRVSPPRSAMVTKSPAKPILRRRREAPSLFAKAR